MTDLNVRLSGDPLPLVGVIGGMGPLASSEFLRTIYRPGPWASEQDAPRVLLWSDPAVADRTEAFGRDDSGSLRQAVERSIRGLVSAGADKVVIACVTAHHILGELPPDLAGYCVSLVDLVFEALRHRDETHLLLCSSGATRSGIFSADGRRPELGHRLVELDADHQGELHDRIYTMKTGADPAEMIDFLRFLLTHYTSTAFVAACSELHLVTRAIEDAGLMKELPSIDPLTIAANRIREGTL